MTHNNARLIITQQDSFKINGRLADDINRSVIQEQVEMGTLNAAPHQQAFVSFKTGTGIWMPVKQCFGRASHRSVRLPRND